MSSFRSFLHILGIIRYMICKYFLPFRGPPFHSVVVSFEARNLEIFAKSSASIVSFVACDFGVTSKKPLPSVTPWAYVLFSHHFVGLALTFRSLIHFELISI